MRVCPPLMSWGELQKLPRHKARHVSGLYFLWNLDECVYVGHSTQIMSRISAHITDESKVFDSYSFIPIGDHVNLEYLEGEYIAHLNPHYNNSLPGQSRFKNMSKLKDILGSGTIAIRKYIKHKKIESVALNFGQHWDINDFSEFETDEQ